MAKKMLNIILIAIFVWIGLSTFDVMLHNNPAQTNCGEYAIWNLYTMFF